MGRKGGDGTPSLRHDQFVGVVGGGGILNGEHLNNLIGTLAGDGSCGGKAEGRGLRIAATLFFHENVICLQRIVVRQGRTKNKWSDKAIPDATNGNNPSRICPPSDWRGWLERVSRMLLPRMKIAADGRHARNFSVAQIPLTTSLTTSAFSQVPWPVAKFSKPPLPTNSQVGLTKTMTDNILIYDKVQEGGILVVEAG